MGIVLRHTQGRGILLRHTRVNYELENRLQIDYIYMYNGQVAADNAQ